MQITIYSVMRDTNFLFSVKPFIVDFPNNIINNEAD